MPIQALPIPAAQHPEFDETLMTFSRALVASAWWSGTNRARGCSAGMHPTQGIPGPPASTGLGSAPLGCTATQSKEAGIRARPDSGSKGGWAFLLEVCAHTMPATADSDVWTWRPVIAKASRWVNHTHFFACLLL